MPLAVCTVTTPTSLRIHMASRENGQFTHFISLECQRGEEWGPFRGKVQGLQDEIAQVFGTGKKVKVESMHLTLGTLLLHEEEVEKIKMELKEITEQFVQMRGSTFGLVITFVGIEYGEVDGRSCVRDHILRRSVPKSPSFKFQ